MNAAIAGRLTQQTTHMNGTQFRFQNMEIWQRGAAISAPLFRLADNLEQRRLHRFAEQLRAAVLSITNNIAEGSGSTSDAEFANYLNIARRSVFEVANMLLLFLQHEVCGQTEVASHLKELDEQSRMLLAFRRTLKS
jgi:four helix bundle protein